MLVRLLRILLAFALACFAAALTMVLFVFTPSEIVGLPPDVRADRLGKAMELATYVAVQIALFGGPFALVSIAIGEMLRKRSFAYYALTGLIIAGLGFFAQRTTEQFGQPTIANNYAFAAFLVSGFIGGFVYWIVSGRFAGHRIPIIRPLETDAHGTGDGPDAKSAGSTTPRDLEPKKF
ncbi:MAG: hypothetical protein AB7E81_14590 [Hyphomicrobiaceae bacterium]